MAKGRPAYTIGSRAVAVAILAEVLRAAMRELEASVPPGMPFDQPAAIADRMIRNAWDVEYKPNAERLVLVIDASIEDDSPEAVTISTGERCPYLSNGQQCVFEPGHQGDHDTED